MIFLWVVTARPSELGVRMSSRVGRVLLMSSSALASLYCLGGMGSAQTPIELPTVNVEAPKQQPTTTPTETPDAAAARQLTEKAKTFDALRSNLYTTIGTTSFEFSHDDIQSLPQGVNQPVEKVLLEAPGVSQDSAASGLLHVRNDHANVQFRINGVMLPDGVTGFGSILETNLIGSISLVTGALPATFGLRTVGLVDITTRTDVFNNTGSISPYGGSRGTFAPLLEYGGTFGGNCGSETPTSGMPKPDCFAGVQYYFTGRYFQTLEGIENPTPSVNPIHDFSQQEKGFGYMSGFIDNSTRLSLIMGTAINAFQIPDVPGQPVGQMGNPPVTTAFGISNFNSSQERDPDRGHPLWGAGAAEIGARLRRAAFLFHPLQRVAVQSRYRRRPAVERHCVAHNPHLLHQRLPGRRFVPGQPGQYSSRRLHCQLRKSSGNQFLYRRAMHRLRRLR